MWPTLFYLPIIHLPIRAYGLMLMIGFLGGTYWAARRAEKVKGDPDFVVNLGFVALLSSIVGARIFYVVHYWDDHFAGRGLWSIVNVSAGGLEFYGGFIGAVLAAFGYILLTGRSIRFYFDVLTPSIMFGMSMARIGCFLNGCCWGAPCPPDLPWAVRFPFASPAYHRQWEERQVAAPAELICFNNQGRAFPLPRELLDMSPDDRQGANLAYREAKEALDAAKTGNADADTIAKLQTKLDLADARRKEVAKLVRPFEEQCRRFGLTASELEQLADANRSAPVHPVQLYASVDGMLLALLLNAYFFRRKRHGMVFATLLLLYPPVRVVEEMIRIDNPHDTVGLTISQFVSVVLFLSGVALIILLRRLPVQSPKVARNAAAAREAQPARRRS